jgi:hypothetical protein
VNGSNNVLKAIISTARPAVRFNKISIAKDGLYYDNIAILKVVELKCYAMWKFFQGW